MRSQMSASAGGCPIPQASQRSTPPAQPGAARALIRRAHEAAVATELAATDAAAAADSR